MIELKQSIAVTVPFELVNNTGAAVTGITPAVQIRKPGGTFTPSTNAATEVGLGVYQVVLTSAETNTLGPLIFSVSGTGAETDRFQLEVVANKNDDLASSIATVDTVADTLEARLTAARAGYLDKLNVSGTLAHSDAAATYRATGFAVPGDSMTLTAGERSTLATVIEAALINEGDGQQLIDAILQVINANLDLPALELTAIAQAVRSELATELGRLDAAISTRLAAAGYTATDNATIAAIFTAAGTTLPAQIAALNDPTAADIAGAVWDEALAGHLTAGSAGAALNGAGTTPPTAEQVAAAVWNATIADFSATGSTGEQLAAAGASGDPWATLVPGAYAEGTAGAAVGRLNNTPAENPISIVPDPTGDPDLAVVYVDTEDILGQVITDAVIMIELTSTQPAKTAQGRIVGNQGAKMPHNADTPGRYQINLETGLCYRAKCLELFGPNGKTFTLAAGAETLNLADA